MAVESTAHFSPRAGGFAPAHAWDRNFFLLLVGLIWLGILVGFGWDVVDHVQSNEAPYALIVHVHAAVFAGWLVLLTTQVALIRVRRPDLHRRLGMLGAVMVPVMVVLGLATAWVVQRQAYDPAHPHTAFMSVNITTMLGFAGLAAAGMLQRRKASAHKRLMLLSTMYLSNAGFARWFGFVVGQALGTGFWPFFAQIFSGADILVLALGAYDLVTRRQLHPAYLLGCGWILINEVACAWLYYDPWWRAFSPSLIGY
jgi:hypothetical protein